MREIKYRFWNKKEKHYSRVKKIVLNDDGSILHFIIKENGVAYIATLEDIEPEEYTGLKDRNGKEIYEGDILDYKWMSESGVAEIQYYEGSYILEWIKRNSSEPHVVSHICYFGSDELEKIGNIHENPELLEDKNP